MLIKEDIKEEKLGAVFKAMAKLLRIRQTR